MSACQKASVVTKMAGKGDILTICCELCRNTDDLRRCARCRNVYYCSREHQTQDWKVHKKTCRLKTTVNGEIGQNSANSNVPSANGTQSVLRDKSHTDRGNSLKSGKPTETKPIHFSDVTDKLESVPIPLPYTPLPEKNLSNDSEQEPVKTDPDGEDTDGVPFDLEPFQPTTFPKPAAYTFDGLSEFAAKGLMKDGYCVIDGIMTPTECDRVLKEIQTLDKDGCMTEGKLAGGRTSGDEARMKINKGIRSDKIIWLDGTESKEYPAICELVSESMDALVGGMNMHLEDHILGRTKAMAACYPGGGSSYHKHIDNPRKDGRRITCIMYLNKDWDVEKSGGFLRIYPSTLPEGQFVDVAPVMNRLLVFWSDSRNPHAVHPTHDTRYAVTVWYFDNEERTAAKAEQADKELASVREELLVMEVAKKQLEKECLEQRIENESRKALNKLDPSELEAIYAMMALHPSPDDMLQQLGIALPIRKLLLHNLTAKKT